MATLATTPYLSVEEYLHTVYRPDVDYVDGYIEERNLGEFDHGTLQAVLMEIFRRQRKEWKIRAALDTRLQVSAHRFRVPDVCITDALKPKEQILRAAPKLCIEVLSPKDTLRKMLRRSEDYFAMGVPLVWIFDPAIRTVTVATGSGSLSEHTSGVLTVPDSPIAVNVDEIFAALDED